MENLLARYDVMNLKINPIEIKDHLKKAIKSGNTADFLNNLDIKNCSNREEIVVLLSKYFSKTQKLISFLNFVFESENFDFKLKFLVLENINFKKTENSPEIVASIQLLIQSIGNDETYEDYLILETISTLIKISDKLPDREICRKYFSALFNIFSKSSNFRSALYSLYLLNQIDTIQCESLITEEKVEHYKKLVELKDEGTDFKHFFCSLKLPKIEEIKFSDLNFKISINGIKNFDINENWNFVRENMGKRLTFPKNYEEIIEFLSSNDIEFELSDYTLVIKPYKTATMFDKIRDTLKIFELEYGEEKRTEIKMSFENFALPKPKKNSKKVKVEKDDIFTKNYNLFRIYLLKVASLFEENDLYDERIKNHNKNFEQINSEALNSEKFVEERKEEIKKMEEELEKKLNALKEEKRLEESRLNPKAYEFRRNTNPVASTTDIFSNWRDGNSSTVKKESAAKPYTFTFKKGNNPKKEKDNFFGSGKEFKSFRD